MDMTLTTQQRRAIITDCLQRAERKHARAQTRFFAAEKHSKAAAGLEAKFWDWRAQRLCKEVFHQQTIMDNARTYLAK